MMQDRPQAAGEEPVRKAAEMPFEAALAELEDIVRKLEQGDVPLEDSIAIYERGEALKRRCDGLLDAAEKRIRRIAAGPDGKAADGGPLDVD